MFRKSHSSRSNAKPNHVDNQSPEKLWSFIELSARYGVHVATVRRWSREGRIAAIQIGRSKRVRDRDRAQFEGEPVREAR